MVLINFLKKKMKEKTTCVLLKMSLQLYYQMPTYQEFFLNKMFIWTMIKI